MGLRTPDISAFKVTSAKIYSFYTHFSPLIDEFWAVLCNSGLVRTVQMRALIQIKDLYLPAMLAMAHLHNIIINSSKNLSA